MTRINCIPPVELARQHLIAEYRELPRIFTLAENAFRRGERSDDRRNPKEYVLGTGHVRFFYPRLRYLRNRQWTLIVEMMRRGYTANFSLNEWFDLERRMTPSWWQDWIPDEQAIVLNRVRLKDRLPSSYS